ncbi:hypothetical protein E3U23_10635 [Erythrobacter litoralis]|uniref:OprO/OprP family phosphate-selective porin n=1 Tax=Erythrobacter litoralis TaxID=39960 RepID=UPI002435E0AE|nr:porin [Erythrobacter litoralis]MDG6079649.1 hypothetical protein [Erythrobacter litoralis]
MVRKRFAIGGALLLTTYLSTPAFAQTPSDNSPTSDEIAELKAQLEALSQRVESLESELEMARVASNAETVVPSIPLANSAGQGRIARSPPSLTQELRPTATEVETVTFKGGPLIENPGGWSFKPRGRLNIDAGAVALPDGVAAEEGFSSEVRRARLGAEGTIPGGFGYKFEVEFAGNNLELTDALMFYSDGGLWILAGQHNTFQSLEELTSARFTSFIERAAFTDAFNFERRLGVSIQYEKGDLLFQGGAFSDNSADLPSKNYSFDGRAVWIPKFGDTQFHLGGSLHLTGVEGDGSVRYRQRPLVRFTATRLIDTKEIEAEREFGIGLETALIAGPFHAAGETHWQTVERPGELTDPTFFGGYLETGLFLTPNDTRGYKEGLFDRVRPVREIGEGGIGAVQVAARYDYLDLNDLNIFGGIQNAYQFSLIWTPTDYTRLLLTYGRTDYTDAVLPDENGNSDYGVDSLGVRAQVDF